jgi:SPP1 family predicted phage head-tail adaptor
VIGELAQRATLLAKTLTPDGGGGFSDSWDGFAEVWVAVEPLGGSDAFGPGRSDSRVRHRLVLRRRTDVVAGQRAMIGARIFRIHDVLDEGPGAAMMTLLCEELP